MVRRLIPLLLAGSLVAGACRRRDDVAPPEADALPTLALRDDSPALLLTWIDGRGDTHVAERIADVPIEGRNPVRVVAGDAGQGLLFYVADLTLKQDDGTYAVRTMPRGEWESMLEARRARAAPPAPSAPATGPGDADTESPAAPSGAGYAIVYGAEWCGPCHQAQAFLERLGVAVTYHDIEKDPARAEEMREKLRKAGRNGGSIPVIDVGGRLFVGYSPGALEGAVARMKRGGGTPL